METELQDIIKSPTGREILLGMDIPCPIHGCDAKHRIKPDKNGDPFFTCTTFAVSLWPGRTREGSRMLTPDVLARLRPTEGVAPPKSPSEADAGDDEYDFLA